MFFMETDYEIGHQTKLCRFSCLEHFALFCHYSRKVWIIEYVLSQSKLWGIIYGPLPEFKITVSFIEPFFTDKMKTV